MRLIHAYLIVYALLVAAAALVSWRAGLLGHLPGIWIALGLALAVGLGLLLLLTTHRGTRT